MKAIVYEQYGPPEVLRVVDQPKPAPKSNEVLIRTQVTTVTSGDWRARSLELPAGFGLLGRLIFGIAKPRQPVLGSEIAGVVEAAGDAVQRFSVGDRVFAFTGANLGCYVQYKCVAEEAPIAKVPDNLTLEQAAALSFGGTTAIDFFRKGQLNRGERVLINGASGGVGTTAIQLAKHYGAHVTGVCSAANRELVLSLGADEVIDYRERDFTELGDTYDLIMDTVGTAPYNRCKRVLAEDGRLLLVLGGISDLLRAPWVAMTSKRRIVGGAAAELPEDILRLAEVAQSGHLKPVIDRRFTVADIAEAHRYVDSGRKRGSVVVTWEADGL